jgi:hypothetical protein
LTVFEAKVAMAMGKEEAEGGLDVSGKGVDKSDEEMTVGGEQERKQSEVLCLMGGSQDAPEFDLSSQDQSQPEWKLGDVNKGKTTAEITPFSIGKIGAPAGEVLGSKEGDAVEVGKAHLSPDWEQLEEGLEEETNTEKGNVTQDEAEDGADTLEEAQGAQEGFAQSFEWPVSEQKEVRQSQRIKEQGLGAVNIAEKATLAAQRKNLEGKHLNLKNSFAVLNNNELMIRSRKMGVKVGVEDLAKFDILKDLESARSNLLDRNSNEMVVGAHETEDIIPLEEMNLLEWKSDVSEEEDFQIVSSRKTKKNKRKTRKKKETPGKKSGHPLDESTSSERGVSRSCSRYNLRKKIDWDKNS